MSLATKYRPKTFEDVCGQKSIARILMRQLELNKICNSYLFCGVSGCGKTTIARIFANMINNNVGIPIEIDGASNNGVDNVKQIISSAGERALDCTYKVIIIDECHMLTTQAWNALLKCIEEPPKYTVFIFCTTDPQKIPNTILNRVMRFNFTRLSSDLIEKRLNYISSCEGFINYTDTTNYISRICNGEMRQGIALLEKVSAYDMDLNINNAMESLGNYSYYIYVDLLNAIIDGKDDKVLSIINDVYNTGNDLKVFVNQLLAFTLDVNKYLLFKDLRTTKLPQSIENEIKNLISLDNPNKYYFYLVKKFLDLKNLIKNDVDAKSTVEVILLSASRCM